MSGHNKWSKIKHKKAVSDAAKSREFSKFARLITLESKKAAGNTDSPSLRAAIDRARAINMPNANIERAVKKGFAKESQSLEEVTYEAYGPGGSAIIIGGLTDNKNRTNAEVKHILSTHNANLAPRGAASWAFEKNDSGWIAKTTVSLSKEEQCKLNDLTDELKENEDVQNVYTNVS